MLLYLLVKLFFKLMDVLALVLPVSFVTDYVLEVFVSIDVITAYNLSGVLNYILGQTDLAGYFDGE